MASSMMKKKNGGRVQQKSKKKREFSGKMNVDVAGIGKGNVEVVYRNAPVAKGARMMMNRPNINGNKTFTVRHSEYLTDVDFSAGFSLNKLPINPGMSLAFPWLSSLANSYESYRIKNLSYSYVPQCATSQPGTVILAIDYDSTDSDPLDKQGLLQKAGAVRTVAWDTCTVRYMQKSATYQKYFVRTGALSPNQDLKTYDAGTLYIGVEGFSFTTTGGELYASYDIEFFTPESIQLDQVSSGSYSATFSNGVALTTPFGSGPGGVSGGLDITFSSNKEFEVGRVGSYLFHWRIIGTGLTNNSNPTSSLVTGDSRSTFGNFWSTGNVIAATTTQCVSQYVVYQPGDKFDLNFTGVGTTITSLFLTVTPIRLDLAKPVPIKFGEFTLVRPMKVTTQCPKETEGIDKESDDLICAYAKVMGSLVKMRKRKEEEKEEDENSRAVVGSC